MRRLPPGGQSVALRPPGVATLTECWPWLSVDLRRCQVLGLAGTACLALGGETAGALPARELLAPSSPRAAVGLAGVYFGVVLLTAAWALLGRLVRSADPPPPAPALTGSTACLVSPITWVHHLVWLLPSFAVLLRTGHPRVAGALYAVMCTSVVWLWFHDASGVDGFLGSNTYVWITLGLLLRLPVEQLPPHGGPGTPVPASRLPRPERRLP